VEEAAGAIVATTPAGKPGGQKRKKKLPLPPLGASAEPGRAISGVSGGGFCKKLACLLVFRFRAWGLPVFFFCFGR